MENWERSQCDVERDLESMKKQIEKFWNGHAYKPLRVTEMEGYVRFERSVNETVVDDDFVLLH